ncbi:hypothetical protein MNV49_000272 [Pseudohyphozyma bogoriensis]|nr:hypothetical protein MNV49_000272 [Pseudohyphozyma bogoriensis]
MAEVGHQLADGDSLGTGDSGVGKSCLMHHFLNNRFRDPSPHTIGVEFSSTLLRLPSSTPAAEVAGTRVPFSKTLKVQLWDTAGQERFRSVTRNYYRGACGAVIVYDITSRKSFEALDTWLTDARALASADMAVVIVGNKLDQEENRQVPYLEASRWAQEHDVLFMETSSLSGDNVEQPFVLLARSVLLAIESGRLDPEKAGSGVSYGERTLRRVSSWGSGLRGPKKAGGGCC